MNLKDIGRWLETAGDSNQELMPRIKALEELAGVANDRLQPRIRELWRRRRPAPRKMVDWDPAGAERVVDQYIILALYKSGDASLVPELTKLVAEAQPVLEGPYDELENAAKVVRGIARSEPVQNLVALAAGSDSNATANAVRVLQLLGMPSPATGGPVSFPELEKPVSFTIRNLKEEIETIVSLSEGRITLTGGAKKFIVEKNFERGEVKRENRTLASVLMDDLDTLGLAYAVTTHGVVICTFEEAAGRWQERVPASPASRSR